MKKFFLTFLGFFIFFYSFHNAEARSEKQFSDKQHIVTFICDIKCPKGLQQKHTQDRAAEAFAARITNAMWGKIAVTGDRPVHIYPQETRVCKNKKPDNIKKDNAYAFITKEGFLSVCLNTSPRNIQKEDTTIVKAILPFYRYSNLATGQYTLSSEEAFLLPSLIAPANAVLENNVKIICSDPCPAELTSSVKAELARNFSWSISTLEKSLKYAIPTSRKPFEVHLTWDDFCKSASSWSPNSAQAFTSTTREGKAYICMLIKPQTLANNFSPILHEASHHYFLYYTPELTEILEEIVTSMPSLVLAQGSRWISECSPALKNTRYRYKLCQAGLTENRIGELARRYRTLEENALRQGRNPTLSEFRAILKEMLGRDVSAILPD